MKKIIYILFAACTLLVVSCSQNLMDDINNVPDNPTDVPSSLAITDPIISTIFNTSSDFAYYASSYSEQNVGIYGQLYNAENRLADPTMSSTYDNSWLIAYNNIYDLKLIVQKCSTGGSEDGNYHTLGIAQILSVYNIGILTDLMGDVPWTEACQPGVIFQAKLDAQQEIYTNMLNLLDSSIINLSKTASSSFDLDTHDPLYQGDATKWIKLAYSLKARYLLHIAKQKGNDYASVLAAAAQGFSSPADEAIYTYNGSTSVSPFYAFFNDRDYFGASQSFADKLNTLADPRINLFWKAHPDAADQSTILFAPNGQKIQSQSEYSVSVFSLSSTAPSYLMSYHELQFIIAEANVRIGNNSSATTALKLGIEAAFQKIAAVNSTTTSSALATMADNYYTNKVAPRFATDPLKEVMLQKYIALFENEAVEVYNDIRRLNADGNGNIITLENPLNTTIGFPLRYAYGASDVTTNDNVLKAYGDGKYVYKENVWWAGGTR